MSCRKCFFSLVACTLITTAVLYNLWGAQTKSARPFGRGPFREATPEFLEASILSDDIKLTTDATHDEWPALAAGPENRVAIAWIAFDDKADNLVAATGRVGADGKLGDMKKETVAGPGAFVMPAITFDARGGLWVVWCGRDGDAFTLYARRRDESGWGEQLQLTNGIGPDSHPCTAKDTKGRVWLAWQGYRDGSLDILVGELTESGLGNVQRATSHPASDWSPAIAAGPDGALHVAWETYRNNSYDVYARTLRNGEWSEEIPVAATPARESHPSLTIDPAGGLWIGYDVGEEKWGRHVRLHQARRIEIRCVRNGEIGEPAQQFRPSFSRGIAKIEWPHLTFDRAGRLWVGFMRFATVKRPASPRAKGKKRRGKARGMFFQYAACFDGEKWTPTAALVVSSGRGHDRLRIATLSSGLPFATWASDGRKLPYTEVGIVGNIYCAALTKTMPPGNSTIGPQNLHKPSVQAASPDPMRARPRQRKVKLGAQTYRLVFGDTHRHTDLSRCNYRGDGTLTDAYRYAIDVVGLDFLSISDHDQDLNGWRCAKPCPLIKRALWWRSQKYADLHTLPGNFLALYGYERGRTTLDGGGHKNVVYCRRGLPVLSMNPQEDFFSALRDTGAVVIPHQLADGPDATDWDKWGKDYERVAEIYQARGSYEGIENPRGARRWKEGHSLADAYAKGVRIGIIASSDHGSTHNAFAGVYATDFTKRSIVRALRARRTFGATEMIELAVTLNGQPMGSELRIDRSPLIEATVRSYEPMEEINVIRGNQIIYSRPVEGETAEFSFTDMGLTAGQEAYYYVRVITKERAQAWCSPFWVKWGK